MFPRGIVTLFSTGSLNAHELYDHCTIFPEMSDSVMNQYF